MLLLMIIIPKFMVMLVNLAFVVLFKMIIKTFILRVSLVILIKAELTTEVVIVMVATIGFIIGFM